MEFKAIILNRLLDKYENSMHYQGRAKVNRRITISFSPKSFPWYWDAEQPFLKKAVHRVVEDLAGQGVIFFKWMPFEKGNLLDSAWLNLEQVDLAYELIGRRSKKAKVKEAAKELEQLLPQVTQEWIKNFLHDCLKQLKENQDFPPLLPIDKRERELMVKTFMGLDDKKETTLLERVFSLKYLGHSKIFQKGVRGRLARIASQYLLTNPGLLSDNPELNEDEIILELGLEKTSEEILVWGAITFRYENMEIDYANFPFGGVIDTKYLHAMELCSVEALKIITIENKANFHHLVNQGLDRNNLLVYIGGFPGPHKRKFLARLYELKPMVSFYHWGDIDLGGFRIFETLRKVVPALKPLFMDESTLLKYKDYCDELEENYVKQLEKLLDKQEYEIFWPVIELMLKERIRLEQEALLLFDTYLPPVGTEL